MIKRTKYTNCVQYCDDTAIMFLANYGNLSFTKIVSTGYSKASYLNTSIYIKTKYNYNTVTWKSLHPVRLLHDPSLSFNLFVFLFSIVCKMFSANKQFWNKSYFSTHATTLQTLVKITPHRRLGKENQQTLLLPSKHQRIRRKVIFHKHMNFY